MTVVSEGIAGKSNKDEITNNLIPENLIPHDASIASLWEKALLRLAAELGPVVIAAWLRPLRIDGYCIFPEGDGSSVSIVMSVANKFSADHIRDNYSEVICRIVAEVGGYTSAKIQFKAQPLSSLTVTKEHVVAKPKLSSRPAPVKIRGVEGCSLNPQYNFSNFIVGSCNQFAHAVSLHVSENPGANYNPVFIYGGVGLGKTHLVNAIGNSLRRRGKNVLMVSSEGFVNELIASIRSNRMQQFKSKFRSLDALIIDDVQFITGKERTQEEFFHTFNELYQKRKQIIITSDRQPRELVDIEERLRTRFGCGVSADIQMPDFETRVAIVSKKGDTAGINLPPRVAQLIAERVETSVRELEGALNRLLAMSTAQKCPISEELAQEALKGYLPDVREDLTPEFIQRSVAEHFSVSISDLLGKRRTASIAFARHVAMYLCRQLTSSSYPEIGALFGGRDHSTVIHGYRLIEEKLGNEEKFKADIDNLTKRIRSTGRVS